MCVCCVALCFVLWVCVCSVVVCVVVLLVCVVVWFGLVVVVSVGSVVGSAPALFLTFSSSHQLTIITDRNRIKKR